VPLFAHVNSLFRNLFRKDRIEKDLDDEIRAHLDLLTDEKIGEGMNREEAARAAKIEIGGIEQIKEEVRAVRMGMWFATVWQDLRFVEEPRIHADHACCAGARNRGECCDLFSRQHCLLEAFDGPRR